MSDQFTSVNARSCVEPNTEFSFCGSPCEATCANRHPICPLVCKRGCFCKNGYIRDNVKRCIPESACPK